MYFSLTAKEKLIFEIGEADPCEICYDDEQQIQTSPLHSAWIWSRFDVLIFLAQSSNVNMAEHLQQFPEKMFHRFQILQEPPFLERNIMSHEVINSVMARIVTCASNGYQGFYEFILFELECDDYLKLATFQEYYLYFHPKDGVILSLKIYCMYQAQVSLDVKSQILLQLTKIGCGYITKWEESIINNHLRFLERIIKDQIVPEQLRIMAMKSLCGTKKLLTSLMLNETEVTTPHSPAVPVAVDYANI